MIIGKNITKTFYRGKIETPVLKGIDVTIAEGEFVSIMGRSGAGKSTLLYQLGLLDHPTDGSIVIDKIETNKLSSNERTQFRLNNLGFVFQDYALLPELTAIENVSIPLLMLNYSKKEAREASEQALEKVGLSHRYDNLPSQLSGGEQQRVSIARAFAHEPQIIFADEPTASLDSSNALEIMKIFEELHKKGQTIVMVTHEKIYADFSERVITLGDGKIIKNTKVKKHRKRKTSNKKHRVQ